MSRADEIAAYLDFLRARVPGDAVLVLKPHPRDSREKIEALSAKLREHFHEVRVLDDERFFYVPFELLLLAALADDGFRIAHSVRLVCFSSSCLGPAFLFGLAAEIGFGPDLVNRAFDPAQRESRIRHEADLASAMARVLDSRAAETGTAAR